MNRELKFRGFSEQLKCFVYGFFQEVEVEGVAYSYIFWQGNTTPVRANSVGQFTGLKDKNGVDIYEGDIIQWTSSNPFSVGEIRKVQVNYIQAQYWGQGRNLGVYLAELLSNEKCEVVGNIHESQAV